MPLPKWLQEKPEIPFGLSYYYRAFVDLGTCRQSGLSEGRISWLAVNEYANRHRLTDPEFDELWEIVSRLDTVYIESRAAKTKIDQSRNNKKPPKRG